jgi:hypothetical protein
MGSTLFGCLHVHTRTVWDFLFVQIVLLVDSYGTCRLDTGSDSDSGSSGTVSDWSGGSSGSEGPSNHVHRMRTQSLLISGPTGCGKSAAVYACAKVCTPLHASRVHSNNPWFAKSVCQGCEPTNGRQVPCGGLHNHFDGTFQLVPRHSRLRLHRHLRGRAHDHNLMHMHMLPKNMDLGPPLAAALRRSRKKTKSECTGGPCLQRPARRHQ